MQTKYTQAEVISLLEKVRVFNNNIGEYEAFIVTDDLEYVVKLSNGRIKIKEDELQSDEKKQLNPEMLFVIANRFVSIYDDTKSFYSTKEEAQKKQKSKKAKIFILTFITIATVATGSIIFTDFLANNNHKSSLNNYEESVKSIEETEKENPVMFLSAKGSYNENLWGGKIKIKCTIENNASVAKYKDVVVQFVYYSKTNTEIGHYNHTLYEVFEPKSSKTFNLKIKNYENVNHIDWKIISATNY